MLNCRTRRPTLYRTVMTTNDLGQTWQEHATNRSTLIEPACNGSLYRFDFADAGREKHLLLFANPHSQKARVRHTLQVSFDDPQYGVAPGQAVVCYDADQVLGGGWIE